MVNKTDVTETKQCPGDKASTSEARGCGFDDIAIIQIKKDHAKLFVVAFSCQYVF